MTQRVKNWPATTGDIGDRGLILVGKIPWRRIWQPTSVFVPRESHGQKSLVGYSPWGCKEPGMTELLSVHTFLLHGRLLPFKLEATTGDIGDRGLILVGKIPWRRIWQPTSVFLPRESHGQKSLVGYSPWGCKEPGMTELLSVHTFLLHGRLLPFKLHKLYKIPYLKNNPQT